MKLVFFEPEWMGHSEFYLTSILRVGATMMPETRFAAVAPAAGLERTKAALGPERAGRVRWCSLSGGEAEACGTGSALSKGLAQWRSLRTWAGRLNADHVHCLQLDLFQLPLGAGLRVGEDAALSGLLFRPSVHYPEFEGHAPSPGELLREARKRFTYGRMAGHPSLRVVCSLDPYFTAWARRRFGERDALFRTLPDPALKPAAAASVPPRFSFVGALESERLVFTLYGVLTRRKGVVALLRGLLEVDDETCRRTCVVLAGKVADEVREPLERLVARIRDRRPGLRLELVDAWLEEEEIGWLVEASDVVLAPYQRFVGSSGVIVTAADSGTPVITQEYGLLGRWTREHGLGLTADTTDPAELAGAIGRAVEEEGRIGRPEGMKSFAHGRTPERFGAAVLDAVREASSGSAGGG